MKSKEITLGGIMVALTSIILYSTSLIPINTLTILTISSAIIPICIIRSNIKTALFVYAASSLIAFFIVPVNISFLYFIFFGIYGIVKFFAEKSRSRLEMIYKIAFFNASFIMGFLIFQKVLGINILIGIKRIINGLAGTNIDVAAFIIIIIISNIVFFVFDYAMTLIITFYMERIHKE